MRLPREMRADGWWYRADPIRRGCLVTAASGLQAIGNATALRAVHEEQVAAALYTGFTASIYAIRRDARIVVHHSTFRRHGRGYQFLHYDGWLAVGPIDLATAQPTFTDAEWHALDLSGVIVLQTLLAFARQFPPFTPPARP